jgi:glycerol-3-phosphate O-acyltransferase
MKHIYPDLSDWPIYKLSEKRQQFIEEINEACFLKYVSYNNDELQRILERVTYVERNRAKSETWDVDPPNEIQFWNRLRSRLTSEIKDKKPEETRVILDEVLRSIIVRYNVEIVGNFKINTFLFARRFLTLFFSIIYNPFKGKYAAKFWGSKSLLLPKFRMFGPLDKIRSLAKDHVLILTPTHSSNLDSILIGYMLDSKAGLPSFSYGAGLNLFNSSIAAYFMNRLGAYRVDRRKKNHIYLEALKSMSHLSIVDNTNSLFFPGGTRSRSNRIEENIKLGLLSTAIQAQQTLVEKGDNKKVIIVPLILCNHFVLEAKPLIEQYLSAKGQERYIKKRDTPKGISSILAYIFSFFKVDTEAIFSFGEPMDIFGHSLDDKGRSIDKRGEEIDIADYFKIGEEFVVNDQRESEYTKLLGGHINKSFLKHSVILHSQMVAYIAFKYLTHVIPNISDEFDVFRLTPKDFIFNEASLIEGISQLKSLLIQKQNEQVLILDDSLMNTSSSDILKLGMKQMGIYHLRKPLRLNRKGQIISQDIKLLYFYHNRLDSYGFHDELFWQRIVSFDIKGQFKQLEV